MIGQPETPVFPLERRDYGFLHIFCDFGVLIMISCLFQLIPRVLTNSMIPLVQSDFGDSR